MSSTEPDGSRHPRLRRLALLPIALAALLGHALAQARPTATRTLDLQAGGGFVSANANTVYDAGRFNGGFVYAGLDFRRHFGVEAMVRQVYSPSGDQVHERTYEVGGRYLRTYGRAVPFAKGMYGRGIFNYPLNEANLAYNLVAGGAGLDYPLKRYLNLRAEFEYQHWFSFPVGGGLTPTLVSIGAAYHFH